VDAVISDVENEFLNTMLSQGDISLEEIKELVDENKIAQKFIEEMNNELLAMEEEPDEISLEELFKISSIFAMKSAIVDTE
jgi:hypothetical protein